MPDSPRRAGGSLIATLVPGYFALVMATGIIAIVAGTNVLAGAPPD